MTTELQSHPHSSMKSHSHDMPIKIMKSRIHGRYIPEDLVEGKARPKHFIPKKNNRDRFGNRLFVSTELKYEDPFGDEVGAALLVSPQGDRFIKSNPGILRDIEQGLSLCEDTELAELGKGRKLEQWKQGCQSAVSLLTVRNKQYVVKTKRPDSQFFQPYINEMLQVQSLAKDLRRRLYNLGIEMGTYLFASGQLSCMQFESGRTDLCYDDLNIIATDLNKLVADYIKSQQGKGNSLWKGIHVDLLKEDLFLGRMFNLSNFAKKSDEVLVWLDPFLFAKPAEASIKS